MLRTAIELADRDGIESLTMRRLGEALGVEAMSLYNHVANKPDLLNAMVDAIFVEIELPSQDEDWRTGLRKRSMSFRDVLSRHPWATGLADSGTQPGPSTLRHHDRVLGALRSGGFTVPLAAHAFALIDSYIYGFVMQEKNLPFETEEQTAAMAHTLLANIPADQYPHLAELVEQHVLVPGYDYAAEFPFGLDLLLHALEEARAADAGR
ncbi:TetR/AcrR family transcriptional regulator [Agrococcus sp. DT81.2]|uniref:TetR/AcrR family transcriptional regulator n=1 Tax=Agrococcus sp. DT81.2 TaxID=3393414 RepID=UPI003CE479AB